MRRGRRRSTAASCSTARNSRSSAEPGQRNRRRAVAASTASCWCRKGYCCKPRWSIGIKPPKRRRRSSISIIWLGPAPEQPYPRQPGATTTGTGSGTPATATSAIRACTKWTSPAGRSRTPRCPRACGASAAASRDDDQGQTPNTQLAVFDYGDALLVFEVRGLVGNEERTCRTRSSNEYYTTEGVIRDGKFYRQGRRRGRSDRRSPRPTSRPAAPFGSFIAAVRSRKPEDNNCQRRSGPLLGRAVPPGEHFLSPGRAGALRQGEPVAGRQQAGRRDVRQPWRELEGRRHEAGRHQLHGRPEADVRPARPSSSPAKEPTRPTRC